MKSLALALILLATPASAQSAMGFTDMGGSIGERVAFLKRLENYPRQMMMPQYCYSACTWALSLRQACITPEHMLYFHGESNLHTGAYDPVGTQDMIHKRYPGQFMPYDRYPALKSYLVSLGALLSLQYFPIDGRTLHGHFGVPYCN